MRSMVSLRASMRSRAPLRLGRNFPKPSFRASAAPVSKSTTRSGTAGVTAILLVASSR
ncbi:MAG: hypothetical protein P8J87_19155 [Verrucomicrobiales bacterium]|nr:hypothetical protein [Verrucomicrobiales bacterium]